MSLPSFIPPGARIVVRTDEGIDPTTHRTSWRDFVGHVLSWDGSRLVLQRDAAANGSRPEQIVTIDAARIARLKPVPERSR
ncbi:MAG: hypothetical protein LKI88_00285 [Bifidobacterium sp.]|jgi:hypothetical protein|nr:hypothetical protein [Bifidobacterium sp.]MCI1864370.1 hypothetical protein [Bifidobacterium sp.]